MSDATLSQANRLLELIAREKDPRNFLQGLLESYGAVQQIGRGVVGQAVFERMAAQENNPYISEKAAVPYNYPHGWEQKRVGQQVEILQEFYPMLDSSMVEEIARGLIVPRQADGLFVVPKPSSVGIVRQIGEIFTTNYGWLVEVVLHHIAERLALKNWRIDKLGPDYLRVRESTLIRLLLLEIRTPGDYLVFPAQTGMKFAGYSGRNSHWVIDHNTHEFGLEVWCGGHMLLTHPERLTKNEDLGIYLPGTEYCSNPGDVFNQLLSFGFSDGVVNFDYEWDSNFYPHIGHASGFGRPTLP